MIGRSRGDSRGEFGEALRSAPHPFDEGLLWLIKGRKGDLSEKFNALNGVSLDIRQG